MFRFTLEPTEENMLVHFSGDIDIDLTEVMEETLPGALAAYDRIQINFADVPFVDSSGIGLLIALVHSLQQSGKSVEITRVRPDVMEVFEMLQIRDILGEGILI